METASFHVRPLKENDSASWGAQLSCSASSVKKFQDIRQVPSFLKEQGVIDEAKCKVDVSTMVQLWRLSKI